MARPKLARDVSLRDIVPSLSDKIEYVRGVFHNMNLFKKEHETAFVRVGITGVGKSPHYRVEPDFELIEFLDDMQVGGTALAWHYTAFDGRNHKKFDWGQEELDDHHWSTERMSADEVQALLGELRGIKRV